MMSRHHTSLLILCAITSTLLACGTKEAPANDLDSSPDMSAATNDLGINSQDMTTSNDAGAPGDLDASNTCPSPLMTAKPRGAIIPFEDLRIVVSGGTGEYRFEFVENNSQGIINEVSGDYLAGRLPNTTDIVRIVDAECGQQITFEIDVLEPMRVQPATMELLPGKSFTYQITEGSGAFAFSIDQNETGGSISPEGLYTAGQTAGRDTILVSDVQSGQVTEALVYVSPDANFQAATSVIIIPNGETHLLGLLGGSGQVTATIEGDAVTFDGGMLTATTTGEATVTLTDTFINEQSSVKVRVVNAQSFDEVPAGELFNKTVIIADEDLDGDGIEDLVFSHPESDLNGWRSGAVFIYKGTAAGFDPEAAQILTGDLADDFYGYDVEVVDLDTDGNPELVVGSRLADGGAVNTGSVFVYRGLADGFFATDPSYTWNGDSASDEFGWDIEACDFNGDGRLDLAIGAALDEDRTQQPMATDQGAVHIFLNYQTGFLAKPDFSLWGAELDGAGEWVASRSLALGRYMASGDMDGDGLCDLAVGVHTFDDPAQSDVGAAYLYKGRGPDSFGPGGLSTLPVRAIKNDFEGALNANFGWRVDMGDARGNGRAALLVGAYVFYDRPGAQSTGAAFLYEESATLPDEHASAYTSASTATWQKIGESNTGRMGWHVGFGKRADGSPGAIMLTDYNHIVAGVGRPGSLYVYEDLSSEAPTRLMYGRQSGDFFGQGSSLTADRDGDGVRDVVTLAARADGKGIDVGELYMISSGAARVEGTDFVDPMTYTVIPFEDVPSGNNVGVSGSFVADLSGDGLPDLAVGASNYEDATSTTINVGAVLLYASTPTGFDASPTQVLTGFRTNSTSDQHGWRVVSAGDFNNDGLNDLAVVAAREDRPRTYGTARGDGTYDDGNWESNRCDDAGSTQGDVGAVYVFLGTSTGLVETEPAFIMHGPQVSQIIQAIAGELDVNNDGYDDLVIGSYLWDQPDQANLGGVAVILGRASTRTGDRTIPICEPDLLRYGTQANDQLGYAMTSMGDLNSDGCDDFAAGARASNLGVGGQGHVRIYMSTRNAMSTQCDLNAMRLLTIAPNSANALSGASLAAGQDVTGDGVPDLVVGGTNYRVNNEAVGAVWLIDGAYLNTLSTLPLSQHETLTGDDLNPFAPVTQTLPYLLTGKSSGDLFGSSVALVPGAGVAANTSAVLIGAQLSDTSGAADSGGAYVWRFQPGAPMREARFEVRPFAIFSGEHGRAGSLLGEAVHATQSSAGKPMLMVAGSRSWFVGQDQGASFTFTLD